ncbi:MAG: AAA family ATPase [Planctomycetaceae bacterium]
MEINLPADTVQFYNDSGEPPKTPLLQQAEREYRDAYLAAAREVVTWDMPDPETIDEAWQERKRVRREAEILVPSSFMFGDPSMDSEQVVYRVGHEIEASRTRGRVQALELAKQYWWALGDVGFSDEEVLDQVMRPWLADVEAWAKRPIDPDDWDVPTGPDDFLTPVQRQLLRGEPVIQPSPKPAHSQSEKPLAITRRLTNVEREQLTWLWPGRIPLGKLTLLAGDPGLGKSFVTLDIAARVSAGSPWPDMPLFPQSPVGVVLFNAEDDLGDTIAPRLDKAGADDRNILIVEGVAFMGQRRHFSLEQDLQRLIEVIEQNPGTRLVIIDPISAYTGKVDSHNNSEVRGLLAPLAEIASRFDLSIVAVTHLSKSGGAKAVYRAMGSLAFAAASRAVWAIVKDQDDPQRRLFLPAKLNLAQDPDGLAYRIVEGKVVWELDPVRMHADDAFAAEMRINNGSGSRGSERREAAEWLREELADGPKPASEVIEAGEHCGFTKRTVQRAFSQIGGERKKGEFNGPWLWSLPADGSPTLFSPTPKMTAPPATRELASSERESS